MFENKKSYENVFFRYAKGPSIASGNEIHPYNEILYYIDGEATFLSEKFSEKLENGTLLVIPKETYHNFRVENQERYTRFVINFDDVPNGEGMAQDAMKKMRIIKNPGREAVRVLEKMIRLAGLPGEHTETAMYGAFLELLYELFASNKNAELPKERGRGEFITRCLSLANEEFLDGITSMSAAKKMSVSESTLVNKFKAEMGISFHKYITEKRMIYARKLMEDGELPTYVYTKCGYEDYSSFYKAYVKMFGTSPSKR